MSHLTTAHLHLLAATLAFAASARAQCPEWSATFGNPGADGPVLASLVHDDGTGPALYVGGPFTHVGGVPAANIARWDGQTWSAVGSGLDGTVHALVTFDDGTGPKLVAGGTFASPQGQQAAVRAWDGAQWTPIGPPFPHNNDGYTGLHALGVFDDGSGPRLYAGGDLPQGVQVWTGTHWVVAGGGFDSAGLNPDPSVRAFFVHDDGQGGGPTLYVGGRLDFGGDDGAHYHFTGRNVARLAGGYWSNVGAGIGPGLVEAFASFDGGSGLELYAGSALQQGAGFERLQRWNGQSWTALGGITENHATVMHFELLPTSAGTVLAIGGRFSAVGGVSANQVATWDGTSFGALGAGILGAMPGNGQPRLHTLAAFDDGSGSGASLFAGGYFAQAGGNASNWIALWNGCGGPATTFCHGDGSAAACPCGNFSAVGARAGCLNSIGTGGTLRVEGRAQISDDTLVLLGGAMTESTVLYFQGLNQAQGGTGFAFGDGVKCTAGPFRRLGTKLNSAGASRYPGAGDAPVSQQGAVTQAGTRHYQAHYRNPAVFCTSATFNYTNAVTVVWHL